MTTINLQLSLPPRKRRVYSNAYPTLPTNTVFDLDATNAISYPGSGQLFSNIMPTPADGSSRAAYDFYLGADASASTDDPTFSGSAGSKTAYFGLDGGDNFTVNITDTLKNLYKQGPNLIFTMVTVFEYISDASTQTVCGTTGTATDAGFRLQIVTGGDLRLVCIGSSVAGVNSLHTGLVSGTRYLHVLTFDNATKTFKSALNSRTFTATGTNAAGANTSDPIPTVYRLGRATGASLPMVNGSKIIAHSVMTGSTPSNTDLSNLVDIYNARHGRTYA